MSNSSIENKIQGLLDRLRTENDSRDRDPLPRVMDNSPNMSSSRNRPHPTLDNLNSGTPTRRSKLNLPVSYQERNIDSTETDNKLREIMKISGILTIDGIKYHTDISDMEHIGELGSGTCGQVVKMRHKPSGAIIAVKQMRRSGNSEDNKRIIMDIDVVLKSHDCPYIVQCLGCFITDSDVWICMELMATCFDKLLKRLKTAIPENVLGKVTFATVKALSYLKEQHDVIHRDVKPSNILVDERGNVKLCDFGISGRLVDSLAKTRSAGCAAYMAPERIEPPNPLKPDYDIRADVWSLGITLVELATGVFPYRNCKTDFEVLTKVLYEAPPTLPKEKPFSDDFRAFVTCCLIKNHLDRPKYVKLLEQPFLRRSEITNNLDVDEWFECALKQADLLGANSPGRRYTPAPTNSSTRRHISLHQRSTIPDAQPLSNGAAPFSQHQSLQDRFLSAALPPDGRTRHHPLTFPQTAPNHLHNHYQKSPEKHFYAPQPPPTDNSGRYSPFQPQPRQISPEKQYQSVNGRNFAQPDMMSGRFSPFQQQRRLGESPPDDRDKPNGRFSPFSQNTTPVVSPFFQRRSDKIGEGFWQSPINSPVPLRKHYHQPPPQPEQFNHASNTSPIMLQRFYHQQKQYQQQQYEEPGKVEDNNGGKKRFASHIKLQLVGDRCNMKAQRHQSPEPPPRLSRGSSTESSYMGNNQSPLAVRRNFLDASGGASPSLSRRYISPSPPIPPPRRLSESSSVPGSPQHFRARFHYTPEPQRRVFHNSDVS